jgi:hypothetical protein
MAVHLHEGAHFVNHETLAWTVRVWSRKVMSNLRQPRAALRTITPRDHAPFLTIEEAARIARCKPKTLRNLMANGTLREGDHFTRPRGRRPLMRYDKLLAWLNDEDDHEDGR